MKSIATPVVFVVLFISSFEFRFSNAVCTDDPDCLNGGTCDTGVSECNCAPGYTGDTCEEVDCGADDPCVEGTCTDGTPDPDECTCNTGYTGLICDQDIDECDAGTDDCKNGGACVNTDGSFTCDCTGTEFVGDDCGTVKCDGTTNLCQNGGTCGADGLCDCDEGYTGDFCADADPCTPNPCDNGGNCTISGEGHSCNCAVGYTGINCESGASRMTTAAPLMLAALFIFKLIN